MKGRSFEFDEHITSQYEKAKRLEWIVTNGLGGYASSTIIGANTRGYHGLLVAAFEPPLKRTLMLTKLEEQVVVHGSAYDLSVNKYPDTIHPHGHLHLKRFILNDHPSFIYAFGENILTKTVQMVAGRNTTLVTYRLEKGPTVELLVRPLINCRGFYSRSYQRSDWKFHEHLDKELSVQPYEGAPTIHLALDGSEYVSSGVWYRSFTYDIEAELGEPATEDHYSPGWFKISLKRGGRAVVIASEQRVDAQSGEIRETLTRSRKRIKEPPGEMLVRYLSKAASQFIVKRGEGKSVIAGYHWFSDWGRDAMIALPGLALAVGRATDAKEILLTFLRHMRRGLIPAFFTEDGPNYASVDSSLWAAYAAYKYFQYTNDVRFVRQIYDTLKEIIDHYLRGTDFGIRASSDGLVEASYPGVPLTWMDVVIDGKPLISRHGKAVEVNTLWYNALCSMESFANETGEKKDREGYHVLAEITRKSFNETFWNPARRFLYDYINGQQKDSSLRPNQILAISLPFPILNREYWNDVMSAIQKHLLTPYGLRTLSPSDPGYQGRFSGDRRKRDEAYHQGTVWAWLIGPYFDAVHKVDAKQKPNRFLINFERHLIEAGLGTVSEVFDGDPPHRPGGCISQAWSVAEILRVYFEHTRSIPKLQLN